MLLDFKLTTFQLKRKNSQKHKIVDPKDYVSPLRFYTKTCAEKVVWRVHRLRELADTCANSLCKRLQENSPNAFSLRLPAYEVETQDHNISEFLVGFKRCNMCTGVVCPVLKHGQGGLQCRGFGHFRRALPTDLASVCLNLVISGKSTSRSDKHQLRLRRKKIGENGSKMRLQLYFQYYFYIFIHRDQKRK